MVTIKCEMCQCVVLRTGRRQKYCPICAKKESFKRISQWRIDHGLIKSPGVGKGGAQKKGPEHHSYKLGTGIFARFRKDACERCGSTKYLCAHHKDRNRKNNAPENIETLCKSCHQIEHRCFDNFRFTALEVRRAAAVRASSKRQRDQKGRFA